MDWFDVRLTEEQITPYELDDRWVSISLEEKDVLRGFAMGPCGRQFPINRAKVKASLDMGRMYVIKYLRPDAK